MASTEPTETVPARPRSARATAIVLCLASFLLLYFLRQESFYKTDGRVMLEKLTWHSQVPHLHFLLPFVVHAFHSVTALFGATLFEAATLVSVL